MSTSPIVTDHLHRHNTRVPEAVDLELATTVPLPSSEPKGWASVELPSLNLSDPVGTVVTLPLPRLKNSVVEPTPKLSTMATPAVLDIGLSQRMAELRAKSASLRVQTQAVRRITGTLK